VVHAEPEHRAAIAGDISRFQDGVRPKQSAPRLRLEQPTNDRGVGADHAGEVRLMLSLLDGGIVALGGSAESSNATASTNLLTV
jgi:hypothetical protein